MSGLAGACAARACCGCCTGCRWRCRPCSGAGWAGCCMQLAGAAAAHRAAQPRAVLARAAPAEREALAARALPVAGPQPARARPALVCLPARLKRLIHVEGDVHLAERSERPVMWLVPHFMALDVAGAATQLFQTRIGGSIYQAAEQPGVRRRHAPRPPALRQAASCSRASDTARPLVRAIKRGDAFFNLPDMDFGRATPPSCPSSACRRPRCWRRRAWRAR